MSFIGLSRTLRTLYVKLYYLFYINSLNKTVSTDAWRSPFTIMVITDNKETCNISKWMEYDLDKNYGQRACKISLKISCLKNEHHIHLVVYI